MSRKPEREEVCSLSPWQDKCQARIQLQEGICLRAIPLAFGYFYADLKRAELKFSVR